jgi:hypothetical protein
MVTIAVIAAGLAGLAAFSVAAIAAAGLISSARAAATLVIAARLARYAPLAAVAAACASAVAGRLTAAVLLLVGGLVLQMAKVFIERWIANTTGMDRAPVNPHPGRSCDMSCDVTDAEHDGEVFTVVRRAAAR